MPRRTLPERSPALARLCESDPLGVEEERRLFNRLTAARKGRARKEPNGRAFGRETLSPHASVSPEPNTILRNRIAVANLRLVVSLAKRFASPQRPLEDLVSEASLLLLRCAEKFDAERGTRFSTYATHALTHHFLRACRRERRSRFLPLTAISPRQTVEPHRCEGIERLIHREELERLAKELRELPARERDLLVGRFGLDGKSPQTFRELASSHGLSKEWARITTADALERLRNSLSN